MSWQDIWDPVRHPQRAFRNWRERRRTKYTVWTDDPPMKIKGKSRRNATNDSEYPEYYAFFGIPYAQPPVGELRLQPPKPFEATTESILSIKGHKENHKCLQHVTYLRKNTGSEDCLYLNIYLPRKPRLMPAKTAVLVFIHGGGFAHGSGDIDDISPDFIIRQDLIFVTVNYRLHIFGFLNTGVEECSGNAGLKDQVQALKWIKANIHHFGGDPNNVTISGHSAGATCVNLHMISPLSRGLFHKAIVHGGGLYCPWGYQGSKQRCLKLFAKRCNIRSDLPNALVEGFIRHSTAEEVLELYEKVKRDALRLEPDRLMVLIGPTKEKPSKEAFLPEDVDILMRRAKPKPLIAGISEEEGYSYIFAKWRYNKDGYVKLVLDDSRFKKFLMCNLQWSAESASKHMDTIRNRYFQYIRLMDSEDPKDFVAILNTDIAFRRFYDNFRIGGQNTAPFYAPFYVYQFSYLPRELRRRDRIYIKAATHGDDVMYLYNEKTACLVNIIPHMKHVIDHMSSMWGNFCRTGTPSSIHETVTWTPHTDENPCYMHIDATSRMVRSSLHQDRWRFMNDLVSQVPVVCAETSCTPEPGGSLSYFGWRPSKPA